MSVRSEGVEQYNVILRNKNRFRPREERHRIVAEEFQAERQEAQEQCHNGVAHSQRNLRIL